MIKTALLSLTCLTLTACATGGPNPNTPLRTIGPDVERPGIFSGKDGKFTGTFDSTGIKPDSEQQADAAATPTTDSQSAGSINVSEAEYEEFQAWKNTRQQQEFEEWKRSREQAEFEAWKRSRDAQ